MRVTTTVGDNGWRRPGPTADQRRNDILIGIAAMVGSTFSFVLSTSTGYQIFDNPPSRLEQVAWAVAVTAPLMWRRRFPEAMMLIISAAYIGSQFRHAQEPQLSQIALFTAIYTAGAWSRNRRVSQLSRAGVIVAMFAWLGIAIAIQLPDMPANAFSTAAGPLPPLLASIMTSLLINVLYFGFAYYFGDQAGTPHTVGTCWSSAPRSCAGRRRRRRSARC